MQPGRKRRLAPESGNLPEELEERFLRQILCLGRISHHPQTERIDPPVMQSVEAFKSRRIALLGEPDRFRFRQFASFDSSRSGHATRRDASFTAMRRPLPELYLLVLYRATKSLPQWHGRLRHGCADAKSFARRFRTHTLIIFVGFKGNVQRPARESAASFQRPTRTEEPREHAR